VRLGCKADRLINVSRSFCLHLREELAQLIDARVDTFLNESTTLFLVDDGGLPRCRSTGLV
jgi:hypothetical protein